MTRTALTATAIVCLACTVSACGGSHPKRVKPTAAATATATAGSPSPSVSASAAGSEEVLSLVGLGKFEGRCPRGARSWTLRFVADAPATDTVSYRVGTRAGRTVDLNVGGAIAFHLVPAVARTHEPADRFSPPAGVGRGLTAATSVPTTAPLHVVIYQATEPQTLRADVDLALATVGGEGGDCALVGSTVHAYTYPNSRG